MTTAIFFDVYGVLMDPEPLEREWRRLIGEYLVPRLGATAEAWGDANRYAADRMFARYRDPKGTPRETHGRLRRMWLREMCEQVGVPTPKNASTLAEEAFAWVNERHRASLPGAIEAVRDLASRSFVLYTSAGLVAQDGAAFLSGLGVRDLFREVYGTDLVDRWKTNSGFYRKVLEHSGVDPGGAVTVDDQEKCLDWAKRAGFARTFLLAASGTASNHETISSLSELRSRL